MDEVVHVFDEKGFSRPGFYYALSDDFDPPMRGNSWYSDGFLKYVDKMKIPFKITHQLLASDTYPDIDYLKPFAEEIIKYPNSKDMANSTIGTMARSKHESTMVFFETSFETASIQYFEMDPAEFSQQVLNDSKKYKKIGRGSSRSVK
jgi:hypothetical protein